MHISFTKTSRGFAPKRGLGLYVKYGNMGAEYGDTRPKLFFDVVAIVLLWTFTLSFFWKTGKNTWGKTKG